MLQKCKWCRGQPGSGRYFPASEGKCKNAFDIIAHLQVHAINLVIVLPR